MLIMAMLDKNPMKRPSIWDCANLPCIKNRINQLVEEQMCQDQVACVFEYKANKEEQKKQEPENPVFDIEKLDVLAHLIRSDIRIQEYKSGWFGTPEKCASGLDVLNWIKDHAEQNDTKAMEIC